MGMLDGFIHKVEDDLEWKAGQEISTGIASGAKRILSKDEANKNKCPKCKKKITESGLKFCPNCGAKLIVTCQACGIEFPAGTKFCTTCGAALKG